MIERARSYVWHHGRVLEQRRFEFLFDGGAAEPVLHAVLAHRNGDGGYGHALEPDGRGPVSQPLHVCTALDLFAEIGDTSHVASAVEHLASLAPDARLHVGVPAAEAHPHSPWWETGGEPSILVTALLAGVLHRLEVQHPWLDVATALTWEHVEQVGTTHPYEVAALVRFLDHVPDRARAEAHAERLGGLVREQRLVDLGEPDAAAPEGYAAGETHKPQDYAASPDGLARRWFSDAEFDRALDVLEAAQQDDGGWRFAWPSWTPVTEHEWGAVVTIGALTVLRAHGRLS
ncbi:hypothetical protein [Umezawaea beigongshangensis]|uniref:hypothetical protein n=1 Tax=Umezawaea beigongshangensis TaxID=2780383 RepID=UPI0018F118C1|nr:hypothetical protein [Umezawaea beigongshangensis]